MNLLRNIKYQKPHSCTKKGSCGTCTNWKNRTCYGNFVKYICDNNGKILCTKKLPKQYYDREKKIYFLKGKVGKTSIYDIKNIDNSLEIYKEVNLTMKKKGYIRKKELIEYTKNNYGIKVTNRMLNWYCKIGLLEPGIMERFAGVTGSVSYWKEDTPKLLYVIKKLKSEGFKVKIKEMKYWLDLLNLNEKDIEEIKKIQEEDSEFNRNIMFSLGIKLKDKTDLLNNYPLKLFDYKKLITRLDIFKRVVILRAYAELDQKKITEIYINSGIVTTVQDGMSLTKSKIDDILDNPKIVINLEIPEIRVNYGGPVNKEVVFKKDGLSEVINN